MKLSRQEPTILHHKLLALIGPSTSCYCEDPEDQVLSIRGPYPPTIICCSCWRLFGPVPADQWELLLKEFQTVQHYTESTWRLRTYQQNHLDREVFMTEEGRPESLPANVLRTIPGHIVFQTPQKASDGSNCAHRWIITEDNQVKCILCEGVRKLTLQELDIIEQAQQAGVIFLKWPERFEAMERAKGTKRRRRKKKGTSKAPGGVKAAVEVPEGFIDVKTAAAKLGTDAKRLRKKIRSGLYEGLKVGGRVYVKI